MKAYVFPGQGAQFTGMGKDLFETSEKVREMFATADKVLGIDLTRTMFEGTDEELKATKITQPAVFLHSVAAAAVAEDFAPDMVAGHSLGEFSALVACGALDFEAALRLVAIRAVAMQKACETVPGTMAAVTRLDDATIEQICLQTDGVVVAANYNCPGQLVISGEVEAVKAACAKCIEAGARRALPLQVGGAFHSPLMEPARLELAEAIRSTTFNEPKCPIYQNADAKPHTDPSEIRANLLLQLTSPVRWTQSVQNMVADGADEFIELGPGKVLTNLVAKIRG